MAHKVVFLDRDGTINEEMGYVNPWAVRPSPRSGQAIQLISQHQFKTVVTNHLGRGYFPETLVIRFKR
jgi:D-glycero-D-manno-heptose 1,7-bisphosphate phosphatase